MITDNAIEINIDSVEHETHAAYLFLINGEEIWLPKSQIDFNEYLGGVFVPEWLVNEKEIL